MIRKRVLIIVGSLFVFLNLLAIIVTYTVPTGLIPDIFDNTLYCIALSFSRPNAFEIIVGYWMLIIGFLLILIGLLIKSKVKEAILKS